MKKLTIGLLGGSFNPPHCGHLYITQEAIKKLGLDWVWWLIVTKNPFKINGGYNIEDRIILSRELTSGCRKVNVVRIEECYSYNVVMSLKNKFKNAKFVWLMGSDNLFSFHYWYRWKAFCKLLPIVVFERDKHVYRALSTPFVSYMRNVYFVQLKLLLNAQYGWNFVRLKTCDMSSSEVRGYSLNNI